MTISRYWHWFAAFCMVAGPAGMIAGNLLGLNQVGTNASTLDWVSAHQSEYFLGVVCFLFGLGMLVLAGFRIALSLTGRGGGLGAVGGTMVLVGGLGALVSLSTYLLSARLITMPGVDKATALMIKDKGDEDGGLGLFILLSVLLYVGFVLLAIGLHRARAVPVWVAGVIAVGTVAAVATNGADTVYVVLAQTVLLVGLAAAAWRSARWNSTPMSGADPVAVPAQG